jgi:hypothetical protein
MQKRCAIDQGVQDVQDVQSQSSSLVVGSLQTPPSMGYHSPAGVSRRRQERELSLERELDEQRAQRRPAEV